MSDTSGNTQSSPQSGTLSSLLTSLQQGVMAINNLTQTMKTIFPSTS